MIDLGKDTSEFATDIKRFTPEARQYLEDRGYVVIKLTGRSLKDLRGTGNKFRTTWFKDQRFENLASKKSEVAINPGELFLNTSGGKTFNEQLHLIEVFSSELSKGNLSLSAKIGQASDYAELAFSYLEKTGERLFGEKHNFDYTRAWNETSEGRGVVVGRFDLKDGLDVFSWTLDGRLDRLFICPLIIPA